MLSISRLIGVEVSKFSLQETNSAPYFLNSTIRFTESKINTSGKDAFKATAEDIYAMFAGEIGQDLIDKFVAAAENYK